MSDPVKLRMKVVMVPAPTIVNDPDSGEEPHEKPPESNIVMLDPVADHEDHALLAAADKTFGGHMVLTNLSDEAAAQFELGQVYELTLANT